jgi:dienelactone hydrolase/lysophospholipase L1-like esterase
MLLAGLAFSESVAANAGAFDCTYTFGRDSAAPAPDARHVRHVPATCLYAGGAGYGFDLTKPPVDADGACAADSVFFFSVDLPEGDYDVAILLGNPNQAAEATVRGESRRLFLEKVATPKGEYSEQSFTVNIRSKHISADRYVRIKPREAGKLNWDGKLTLEFNGVHPGVRSVRIRSAEKPLTVFLCGNSTVVDQDNEPWCGWGQMIPRFFGRGISFANYAESGEAANTFIAAGRLEKVLTQAKAGDYIFVEFGHNDQKQKGEGKGPWLSYTESLRTFIVEARSWQMHPVLVTPVSRRVFDERGKVLNTHGEYPDAVRKLAADEGVPLIDLHRMSATLYEAWGSEASTKAFVHYPAGTFPGQAQKLEDNTHFNAYGGYEVAKCIVEGIRESGLADILRFLREDYQPFDPKHPDSAEAFSLPLSPFTEIEKPDGDYLRWMQDSLPDAPEWTAWQKATGELPPDFGKLPKSNLLPAPLRFFDGSPVGNAPEDWAKRRGEIKRLFEKYVTGTFPPKPRISSVVTLDEARGDRYTVRNVRVEFGGKGKGSVRVRVIIPDGAAGEKLPVMVSPNLVGWGAAAVRRGYIHAGYAGNDGMDDAAQLKELYPDFDFAALPRRAWLAQLVVDYLITLPQVDTLRIAINGYSRDGKMAIIAAAFDERIAAVLAGSTGVGGVVPWRFAGERGGGEGIETTTRSFPSWFVPRLRYFAGQEDRLPVDANLFLALIAPRAALLQWGYTDQVANGWAMEQAYHSAQKVYERLGQPERMGLLAMPGFHGSNDVEASFDWLDWQLGRTTKKWTNRFIFPWDFDRWRAASGEKISLAAYPPRDASAPVASSRAAWSAKAPELRSAVRWMLGEAPPMLAQSPAPAMRGARPAYGPVEVGKGAIGNPGQLAPDVPAWVIATGGASYGWPAPEKNRVASRRIRFGGVTGDLYYPADTPEGAKLPTVIWLHGFHYPLGYMWVYRKDLHPILALTRAGYAVLAYDQQGFGTRWSEAAPFYDRFPRWSRMGKMLEDLHEAVSALQKDTLVDAGQIGVYGFAMGGTLALYAAALDERISCAVSIAGFTPMRTDVAESGMSGMTRYSHLYGLIPRLGLFAGSERCLPYDYDDLMALIAPRPLLIVQPLRDRDASPVHVREAVGRAGEVYAHLNAAASLSLQEPDDYGRLTDATQDKAVEWIKQQLTINN